MADTHFSTLLAAMRSGEFSDLKFLCNGKTFFVHRNIVCAQSSILNSAVRINLTGSLSDTVSMHDFDIPTIENFVQYLYTGDYPSAKEGAQDSSQQDDDVKSELLRYIQCHHIASLYRVDKMMTVSRSKLQALLEKHQGSSTLSSALPDAIRLAHVVSASQDIMNALAASVARNIGKLMDDGNLSKISNVPEFLLAVLEHSARNAAQLETDHAKGMRQLRQNKEETAAMKGSMQLLRDNKSCMNGNCGEYFNVEITDAFEVACGVCRQRQKIRSVRR